MDFDRIDLADIHDPQHLARAVHLQLGQFAPPVPVVEIALALDIGEVRIDRFDGFEGMLLTDKVRSRGAILANDRGGRQRARFTVAHELGHFLLERHTLNGGTGFTCTAGDLRETRLGQQHLRQESEANGFAINLLAPSGLVMPHLSRNPDLGDGMRLRKRLDLSLEACVRRMVELREDVLAAVWSYKGAVRYAIRDPRFPFVNLKRGDRLPQTTRAFRTITEGRAGMTSFTETHGIAWTRRPELDLFEQTRLSKNGHAVTLLWADLPDDDDEDDLLPELGTPRFR